MWIRACVVLCAASMMTIGAGAQAPAADATAAPDGATGAAATEAAPAAEESAAEGSPWEYTIAPYLLFPFMTGEVELGPVEVQVGLDTGDILGALNWGLMLYLGASSPDWAVSLDTLYMNLGRESELPVSDRTGELRIQQLMVEATALRRVLSWLEVGLGGRVNWLETGVEAPAGMVAPPIDRSLAYTFFDPFVVTRMMVPLPNDDWRLGVRADFGGFTLGSIYAWQVYSYAGYRFNHVFELGAAFRAMGMKYETGSGLDYFLYDMIIYGPEIGFVFHI